MAKLGTQSLTFKSVRHKQTDRQTDKKINVFDHRNSIPCTMPQCLADPTAGVPYSNAANIGEGKTRTQREFCTWRNSVRGQEPLKMYIHREP